MPQGEKDEMINPEKDWVEVWEIKKRCCKNPDVLEEIGGRKN